MIIHTIYVQPLKTIIAIIITMLIVWTIMAVCFQKHTKLWRVLNAILIILSLITILYMTITKREADVSHTIPFIRTIEHIRQQPELIREMVMNAFLFFPFGLTMPYAISGLSGMKNKKHWIMIITILAALLLSGCIEFIQYLYNLGSCELSDIVMNTLGAAIGSVSYLVNCRLRR